MTWHSAELLDFGKTQKSLNIDPKVKTTLHYVASFYCQRRYSYLGLVSPLDFEYKYNQKIYEKAA
jgi:hypothetical protein